MPNPMTEGTPPVGFKVTLIVLFGEDLDDGRSQVVRLMKRVIRLPFAPTAGLTLSLGSGENAMDLSCNDITYDLETGEFTIREQFDWHDGEDAELWKSVGFEFVGPPELFGQRRLHPVAAPDDDE